MVTKEQERKALEQIKKIVDGLGPDSYIATAFEGCFDDAEENIENDFAVSNHQRWQSAEHRAKGLAEDVDKLQEQIKELGERLAEEKWKHSETEEALKEQKINTDAEHKAVLSERSLVCELKAKVACLDSEVHEQAMTIMELKAKLYDMMMAKEGK